MKQQRLTEAFSHRNQIGFIKPAIVIFLCGAVFVGGLYLSIAGPYANDESDEPALQKSGATVETFEIDTSGIIGGQSLSVGGQLRVNNTLVLSPSSQPAETSAGQIYFDAGAKEIRYYDGTSFQGLASTSDVEAALQQQPPAQQPGTGSASQNITNITQQTINNYESATGTVTETGNNTFTGANTFTDISVEDFTASGSAALQGSLTVTGTTLLGPASASSLLLSSALDVASGGTGRDTFNTNEIVIGQGSGALATISNGAAGLCLLSTAGAPSFQACPGGGSAGVSSLAGLTGDLLVANSSTSGSTITIDTATSTNRGLASFNATNLTVTAGSVNTVQNIGVTAAPTFAGITVNGLINGQTISSAASLTGTLSVAGATTATGGIITNSITSASGLSVGSSAQTLSLQGGASSTFSATSGANTTTLQFQTPTANANYRFATATAGTYDVCTTAGNCVGVGGSVSTSGGTSGQIAKFDSGNNIVDSLLSESGVTVTADGNFNIAAGSEYRIDGVQISSSVLSNDSNLAKLNASQTFSGQTIFRNTVDSSAALSLQNAAGNDLATLNTTNGSFELGDSSVLDGKLVVRNLANNFTVTVNASNPTGNHTVSLGNESGTICLQNSSGCGFITGAAANANYVQNQNSAQQVGGNFWIAGTGRADTALQAPVFDAASSGALTLGGANATSISITQDTTLAASKSLTISGGATGTRPAVPSEGMVYYDTTTKQLLTYANGKWQADRSDAILVAASNSTQADKDAADYLANGNTAAADDGDQVQINSALTAAAGRKVVLLAGTYTVDNFVAIPNDTTLAGVGQGSLITLPDSFNSSIGIIYNQDSTTGSGVAIQDLRIDGNAANQASGSMVGISLEGLGGGARQGARVANVVVSNMTNNGVTLQSSSKTTLTGVASTNNGGSGIALINSNGNVVSGNVGSSNSFSGIALNGSSNNTVSDNVTQGNAGNGILLAAASNTNSVSGNIAQSNGDAGIHSSGSSYATITGNIASGNIFAGIAVQSNSTANIIIANKIHDNGGSTQNNGIFLWDADSNQITSNSITDSSATSTNFAIHIYDATVDASHLADNSLGAGSINNLGTATVMGGQLDVSGNYAIQPGGEIELLKNTNVTGALAVSGNATVTGGILTVGAAAQQGSLAISDGSNNTATIQVGNLAGNYTYQIPVTTANDTFCLLTLSNCSGGVSIVGALDGGTANATGASIVGATIFLQSASGTNPGLVNTTTQTFAGNKTFTGTLSVQDVTIAASKSLTITGGATGTRPAVPTEGMVYYDVTTKQLLTYANGKWQADHSANTKIVAASNSTQTAKDAADYVADGAGDEVEINAALTAATGGKVYLMEGTYTAGATILVPNDTVLSGSGRGTLIRLADIDATDNLIENASAQPRVTIRDLRIDGQKSLNTAGTQNGIYLNGGAGTVGPLVENVEIMNFRTTGLESRIAYASITNVTSESNTWRGFDLSVGTHQELESVTARSNGQQGILVDSGADLTTVTDSKSISNSDRGVRIIAAGVKVSNNTVTGNSSTGIEVATDRTTVTGNTVTGNPNGIVVTGNNNTITDNSVSSNTGDGITVGSSTNTTISSNYIGSNSGIGISVGNIVGITITSNTINSNASYGIQLDLTDQALIANNYISNNGGAGGSSSIRIYSGCCGAPDENRIIDNIITDTAGSGFAIVISNGSRNYLSGNTYSGTGATSISDSGTGTIYANQLDANGHLINRGTAAMSVNTATITSSLTLQGGMTNTQLPTPALPVIGRVGTAGTTTYGYKVTALDGTGETLPSTEGTIATANATLTGANYNTITWVAVPGAVQYKIYRTTSGGTPASTGLIGTVNGSATSVFNDTGIAATTAAPAANTTGGLSVASNIQGTNATLTGGTLTLGTTSQQGSLAISDGSSNTATIQVGDLAGNYTYTIPVTTANDTFCMLVTANCGGVGTIGALDGGTANATGATITGSTLFLQSASGTNPGLVNTSTQTFAGNKTFTGALSVQDTTVGAGTSITFVGGITGTRPAVPSEGMVYYDTTTKQLLAYANGKWQADRSASTKIVAASNSTQAAKDAADYVADGNTAAAADGDQIQINAALIAAAGGKVYLLEGTYVADATILIPNDTTLAGAGRGTVIELADLDATDNLVENSDVSGGTGVVIQDLRLEGRKDLNTAGTQHGVLLAGVGNGSGSSARQGGKITNVTVNNFRDTGIRTSGMNNSVFSGNTTQANGADGFFLNSNSSSNTLIGNLAQGNSSSGFSLSNTSSQNTITGNTAQGNSGNGFAVAFSSSNTFTGNTAQGNTSNGFDAGSSSAGNTFIGNTASGNTGSGFDAATGSNNNNTFTSNTARSNVTGFYMGGTNNNVSGNMASANTSYGIRVSIGSNISVTANKLSDNGGATTNNGIFLNGDANNNTVTGNDVTDTSATTNNYAINVSASQVDNTYLSNNNLGTGTINDIGTNTIYVNQLSGIGNVTTRSLGAQAFNTTTVTSSLTLQGGMTNTQLPTPALPVIGRVGTAGTTTYGYKVTALDGTGETLPSTEGTIATANATLTGANYNTITWAPVPGAVQYKIYRTTSGGTPASTGLIGTVTGSATSVFNDTGIAGGVAAPGSNTSGGLSIAGAIQGSSANLTGGLTVAGATALNGSLTATGTAMFKNTADSAAAFQIQDSSSNVLFSADTTTAKITVRTLDVTFNLTVAGHIISGGSTPSIAADTAACTSPTVGVSGTDTAGTITVTTGTGCAAPGNISTITFSTAFGAAPKVTLTPASAAAAGLNAYLDDATIGTGSFKVGVANTPADSTIYKWNYHAVQ